MIRLASFFHGARTSRFNRFLHCRRIALAVMMRLVKGATLHSPLVIKTQHLWHFCHGDRDSCVKMSRSIWL